MVNAASVRGSFNVDVPQVVWSIVSAIGRKIGKYEECTGEKPHWVYMSRKLYDILVGDAKKALEMFPCIEVTLYGIGVKIDDNMSGIMYGIMMGGEDFGDKCADNSSDLRYTDHPNDSGQD